MSNNPLQFCEHHHLLRLQVVNTTWVSAPRRTSRVFFTPTPKCLVRNLHLLAKALAGAIPLIVQIKNKPDKRITVGGMPTKTMKHQRVGMVQAETQYLFAKTPVFSSVGNTGTTGRPGPERSISPKASSICVFFS